VINDRVDVALAGGASAVQLGARSLPVAAVRRMMPGARIGYSAHDAAEVGAAAAAGTDWLLVGTIYPSASHPGGAAGGVALLDAALAAVQDAGAAVPVLAIGGVTPARVAELSAVGAHGVAVLGGVWHAADPTAAAQAYIVAIEKAWDGT
jgi:thiazole tautomerase (transcriptional regulator TenI)